MLHPLRAFFKRLGPGFITGASDDDPSGIATYTQVGAQFGLGMVWTTLLNFPLMTGIQEMCSRIGLVSGEGLTAVVRKHFPKSVLWLFVALIFIANTVNIGADLGAMADSTRLLLPAIPFPILLVFFTVLILALEIFITYKTYAEILKWLGLALLSYMATAFIVTTDWTTTLQSLVFPTIQLTRDYMTGVVAVFGTTISPYLFIWQSDEEVEEEIVEGKDTLAKRKGASKRDMQTMRVETATGMTFSQLMTFFIIVTAAGTFFKNGLYDIQTTAQAAEALRPLAGAYASYLFAIGVVGTGLLAVPVLSASASYALSEAVGWTPGLYKKLKDAHGFYGAITIATLVGLLINFVGINPIKALFWTAVLNGVVTPPLVLIILAAANNKKIMGRWTNGKLSNIVGIATFIVSTAGVVLMFAL